MSLIRGLIFVRAISSPIAFHLGFAFIYLGKFATGLLCAWGTFDLWKARSASVEVFDAAKFRTVLGCCVGLFFLFFGFFSLAGAVFNPLVSLQSALSQGLHQFALFYIGESD